MDIKLFTPMVAFTLLTGCGGGDSAGQIDSLIEDDYCTTEFVSNDAQPSNTEGYYGDEVCFGTKRIVGKWKRLLPWSTEEKWEVVEFKSDGHIQFYDINGTLLQSTSDLQQGFTEYGVSSDGTELRYYGFAQSGAVYDHHTFEFVSIFSDKYPDYFLTDLYTTNLEVGTYHTYEDHTICKIKYDENMTCGSAG